MAQQVALEDSNVAHIGSAEDKAARVAAARTEAEWSGAGQAVGIEIWRVIAFNVHRIPKEEYGTFYDGDSYIVLHTYPGGPHGELAYDVHYWIGEASTQDEYGTVAYKTVELDDLLGCAPVQYREVQGHESNKFLAYFEHFTVKTGGVESGLRKHTEQAYQNRLYMVKGRHNVQVRQQPLTYKRLNSGDVFILDAGAKVYRWMGSGANIAEKYKSSHLLDSLRADREGHITVIDEVQGSESEEFWEALGGQGPIAPATNDIAFEHDILSKRSLHRLHVTNAGEIKFDKVATGRITKDMLKSDDVFIIDLHIHVIVWIGRRANLLEKKHSMPFAEKYVKENNLPPYVAIIRCSDGTEPALLLDVLAH